MIITLNYFIFSIGYKGNLVWVVLFPESNLLISKLGHENPNLNSNLCCNWLIFIANELGFICSKKGAMTIWSLLALALWPWPCHLIFLVCNVEFSMMYNHYLCIILLKILIFFFWTIYEMLCVHFYVCVYIYCKRKRGRWQCNIVYWKKMTFILILISPHAEDIQMFSMHCCT